MPKFFKAKYIIQTGEKVLEDSSLVVENGKISNVIKSPEQNNCENIVIAPAFINLHTHLQYTGLKNVNHSDFSDWIINLVKQYYFLPKEKKIELFKTGLKEAVLSGCTSIAQLSEEDFFPEILDSYGLRNFIFLETFSNSEERTKKEIKKLKDNINKIRKNCSNNLVIGISPHSIYNVHKSLWQEIAKFAAEENLLVHTHLAESQDEVNWLAGKPSGIDKIHMMAFLGKHKPYETGLNSVEYLEKLGVLNILKENLIAAHCIELNEKSFEKLVNYGAKIAHCPRSNIILHGKTLNLNTLPSVVIDNMVLGTDSRASNYDLSVLNEAKYLKGSSNLSFDKIIDLITINSARVLKIDDKTGSLEKGKDADFLVFKLNDGENYEDILNKGKPDYIYTRGEQFVLET